MDRVVKVAIVIAAVALLSVAWRGVPVELVIAGPSSSSGGIPLTISGGGSSSGRYEIVTATNGVGTVFVTRVDKWTGSVEVFRMNLEGKLEPVDRK